MIWLQLIVSLFVLAILLKLFQQRSKGKLSLFNFILWLLLWLAVLLVFWRPESASYLANRLGVGRGSDLIIYLSILIIFYLLFKVFVRLNKIDADITKLTREDANRNAEKK